MSHSLSVAFPSNRPKNHIGSLRGVWNFFAKNGHPTWRRRCSQYKLGLCVCVWGRGWKNAFRQREIFAFQQANRIYAQNKQIRNSGESKLVGALGHSEQEKWAHVGDDLACVAASEMEEAANIADTRKNMVEGAGPFGPRGSELPINAADMFDELECRSGVI